MSNDGTILVTGATGNTGSGVVAGLLAQGRAVRALVRDVGKAAALADAGAEVVAVDLDKPETLADGLFDGVEKVYFVTWNGSTALEQWQNFLAALQASGATPHVVRHGAFGTPESRIIVDIQKADEELRASALPWTILAPTFFMQNVMMTAPTVKEQGAIYWDWGEGKAGMVDVRDVIDCAVGVLTGQAGDALGQRFVLTGPASIGFADVAATLSEVLGREVSYVPVPHEAALESMKGMGIPEFIAHGYAELGLGFEAGFADTTTDSVERLAAHPPRSFATFARDFKAAFA